MEVLTYIDQHIFFILNGYHSAIFDRIMWIISEKVTWVPLYLWFLWLLFREYRKNYWMVLVAIILMIIVSDQLCNLSKETVMRFRPSNDPMIGHLVHTVNSYRGGSYGFYSGHASNSFAVAVFMIVMVGRLRKILIPICLFYALIVSYSRIYLGVHYPLDVLAGALAGSIIALTFGGVLSKVRSFYNQKKISDLQ